MILPTGVVQSIDKNKIEIAEGWLYSSLPIWTSTYSQVLAQPVSVSAVGLSDLRFMGASTTIVIRKDPDQTSQVVWSGVAYLVPDPDGGGSTATPLMQYAGVSDPAPPEIVDLGLGFISVAACSVNLYDSPDFTGPVTTHSVSPTTVVLTPGLGQYICVAYNAGAPQYYVESNLANITGSDIVPIYAVWLAGTGPGGAMELHSTSFDSRGIGLPNKIADMLSDTRPYSIAVGSSLVVGETATPVPRTVTISAAKVYSGVDAIQLGAVNSSVTVGTRFTMVYHVAGVWTFANQTQYDNTNYDNGTDLVPMTNNRYGVRWIYRSIGDDIQSFYVATGNYANIADARAEGVPTGIPPVVQAHSVLVGRFIIQKGLSAAVDIEQVSATTFSSSSPATHNALNGLQGNGPEYYHLTAAQLATFNAIPSTYLPLVGGTLSGNLYIVTPASAAEIGMSSGVASANVTISFTVPGNTWFCGNINSGVSGVPVGAFALVGSGGCLWYQSATMFRHNTNVDVGGGVFVSAGFTSGRNSTTLASYILNTPTAYYAGIAGSDNATDKIRFVICNGGGTILGLNAIEASGATLGRAAAGTYLAQTAAWFGHTGFNLGAASGAGFWAWSDGGAGVDVVSGKTFSVRVSGSNVLTVDSSTAAVTGKLTVSSFPTLFGATLQPWGAGRNATTLGGTCSIEQTYSGGDYLLLHNNCYFDGSTNRSISNASASCTQLGLLPDGTLSFEYAPQNGFNGPITLSRVFAVRGGGDVEIYGETGFLKSGTGTYTRNAIYVDNAYGFVIERGRATDSGTAAIRSFRVSQRGGGTDFFEVADGTTYSRQAFALESNQYMVNNRSINGQERGGDGGRWMHHMGNQGSLSGISTGTSTANINRYPYAGFSGFVGTSNEFYGITLDHQYAGPGAQLSIIAGQTNGRISFFAGAPGLKVNGYYQAPLVGDWTPSKLTSYVPVDIAGTLYVSQGIQGVNNNSSAASGIVGEYVTTALANTATVSVPTSGELYQVFALVLSAGDWDVTATVMFTANTTGLVRARAGIEAFNDRITSDGYEGDTTMATGTGSKAVISLTRRISTNDVTWTYYVMVQLSGTYGASGVWGNMSARRVR